MKQTLTLHVVGVAASSMSLILIHQLEDKLKAHDLYLCFLKNVDLWSRVCRSVCVIRAGLWTFKCYYFACLSRLLPDASVAESQCKGSNTFRNLVMGAERMKLGDFTVFRSVLWVPFQCINTVSCNCHLVCINLSQLSSTKILFWNRETNQWRIG